jgi:TRAP-type C4-dicarboxylate transport system permease small subunit
MIKIIDKVKPIAKILLIIAIICMLLSSFLTLWFGNKLTVEDEIIEHFI